MSPVSVGIGLRDPYVEPLLALKDRGALDVLEVMIDDARLDPRRLDRWRALSKRWPLVAHGTGLGPGDACGVDPAYVSAVSADLRAIGAHWYSEHLCFLRTTRADGTREDLGHFAPMVLDDEDVSVLAKNVGLVRSSYSGVFLLENAADILALHGEGDAAAVASGKRFARVLVECNVGALLDLTNLALQARNDRFDPMRFLEFVPWERVIEVHLAGGRRAGDLWIDSHDHAVDDESWRLLAIAAERARNLRAVIIERDENLPPLDALLAEVARARRALR
ncbi:MAG: DUF692 family protein [Myxococcales bacterium]|nr:DUF692 family protein [Myxococcales bacterium]